MTAASMANALNEKQVMDLCLDADRRGDFRGLQEIYVKAHAILGRMPKVHSIYAGLMHSRGYEREAYASILTAIVEHRQLLQNKENPKTLYDYALSHCNATEIAESNREVSESEKLVHIANGFHYMTLSRDSFHVSRDSRPKDDTSPWWLIDAPILLQEYWIGNLLTKDSIPSVLRRLNLEQVNRWELSYYYLITFRAVLHFVSKPLRTQSYMKKVASIPGGIAHHALAISQYDFYSSDSKETMNRIVERMGTIDCTNLDWIGRRGEEKKKLESAFAEKALDDPFFEKL
jgi:hypothetical protein